MGGPPASAHSRQWVHAPSGLAGLLVAARPLTLLTGSL
ncbi:MAG TPA: DUF3309 domain-containing protein [Janthinobacterium sp.]|nr:DUF3309 domain-containing protein [Janthinobacterium sp.]